jgi:putative transcriptional regulator
LRACSFALLDVLEDIQYAVRIKRKEQRKMLGENIKMYRKKKQFTQEEIAAQLHVTRQTISKWEKDYSVPDAEMLVRLAEILEVQTSQLLGTEGQAEAPAAPEREDALAEQLAHIAEQMAIRNRRSKRIWKTIGIVLAAIVAVNVVITVLGMVFFSVNTSTGNVQTYEETEITVPEE